MSSTGFADVLATLEPPLVWKHFLALTRIPRPSKREEQAREHVLAWARERELDADVDAGGNVVVRVPATRGREAAPVVVLQAHLDMVCERDADSSNDPRVGRIEVVRDGEWVAAVGTTLGADNGIGVAAAMAVTEDAEIEHGPLELLLTVSEEEGLDGAKALDPALVSGRILVNLDGTSDTGLTVGCAGSTHTFTRLPLSSGPTAHGCAALEVAVSGARGGHSGGDIAKGRVNAIKALGRVLSRAYGRGPYSLGRLDGGVSRNAIPREARALVSVPAQAEAAFREAAEQELAALREHYAGSDDGLVLAIEPAELRGAVDEVSTARALDLLTALPTGVIALSPRLPGAVETSTSLNVASSDDGVLVLASMSRSSSPAALADVTATIEATARLAGADVESHRSYPPWRPDLDSRLLTTARATFSRLFGDEPQLEVVHGGLECAVIGSKLEGVEMVAIGPDVVGLHAPGERLSIPSTQRFYRLLGALLDDVSRL